MTGPTEHSVALELDLANAHALQEREKAAVIAEGAVERANAAGEVAGETPDRGQNRGTRVNSADIVSKTTSTPP